MRLTLTQRLVLSTTLVTASVVALILIVVHFSAGTEFAYSVFPLAIVLVALSAVPIFRVISRAFESLQHESKQLGDALEVHDKAHKQWVADTSHELRTPIAILRAQVEALQDGVHTADAKTLGVLHSEIMMMGKLVDDLHDLAKSDVGQLKCESAPVQVASVLNDALDAFDERLQAKGISVTREYKSDDSLVVTGDSRRLMQLFNNLLENSLRYTYEGGSIKVGTTCSADKVTITFDDSKPSVRSDLLEQIFQRFSRGEVSRSRAHGGTGLGLAICRTIAEAHGGTIIAAQSPLGGLRVQLTLPLERSAVHA